MNNLKNLRIEKNLTQKEIADFLKCNQTAVGKYERGDSNLFEPIKMKIKRGILLKNCAKHCQKTKIF